MNEQAIILALAALPETRKRHIAFKLELRNERKRAPGMSTASFLTQSIVDGARKSGRMFELAQEIEHVTGRKIDG